MALELGSTAAAAAATEVEDDDDVFWGWRGTKLADAEAWTGEGRDKSNRSEMALGASTEADVGRGGMAFSFVSSSAVINY